MEGVVSLLPNEFDARIRNIWSDLDAEFGLRGVRQTPFPHLSYHVAEYYGRAPLIAVISELARDLDPFTLNTTGVRHFDVAEPVLYVAIESTPELKMLQRTLWQSLQSLSSGAQGYYHPDTWVPHITLAAHDLKAHQLSSVLSWLRSEKFMWEMTIDSLAIVLEENGKQVLNGNIPFGDQAADTLE
jgi:hypothetical protein